MLKLVTKTGKFNGLTRALWKVGSSFFFVRAQCFGPMESNWEGPEWKSSDWRVPFH